MKQIRLTPAATARIEEIVFWTIETFGARQAELYETALFDGLRALASGDLRGRSCNILAPRAAGAAHFLYARINRHFIIFVEVEREIEIVDLLHTSRDLPTLLETLGVADNEN